MRGLIGFISNKIHIKKAVIIAGLATAAFLFSMQVAFASEEEVGHALSYSFLWIAAILLLAKISSLVEKIGQPAVLGELVMGVLLGNLVLFGIHVFEPVKTDEIILFLSELGVIILLFQIGLESQIREMLKVGARASAVALIGVVAPFALGAYILGPSLLPGLSTNAYLFLGAALTATSVGITARVFRDLRKLQTAEAKIVLGAAVIDDILGLLILAVVSAIVTTGNISVGSVGFIVLKAFAFLAGSIYLGQLLAPRLGQFFSKIHTGVGMKFTLALSIGLIFAFLAQLIGLAAIVGAFAAGLILDPVHFKFFKNPKLVDDVEAAIKRLAPATKRKIVAITEIHSHKHIEDLIEPISFLLVPIFFVVTGMQVNLSTLSDPKVVAVALAITIVAIIGKVISGFAAGDVSKALVGFGMVPRGEVGLIFANIGKGLGVVSDDVFSVIIIMVILTTLITPPILSYLLQKGEKATKPTTATS